MKLHIKKKRERKRARKQFAKITHKTLGNDDGNNR